MSNFRECLAHSVFRFREITLVAVIFLVGASAYLSYDTFRVDELVPASLAVNTIIGNPNGRHTSVYLNVLGRSLPVNRVGSYDFALPSFILMPLIKYAGASISLVKVVSIAISLIYIILLYAVIGRLFDRRAALITVLLLAVSPNFIYNARNGFYTTEPIINLIFISGISCFLLFDRRQRDAYIYAGAFLLGMCLSVKLSAVSRYAGLLAGLILVYPGAAVAAVRSWGVYRNTLAVILFCLGAFLFVYYNAVTGGRTLALIDCLTGNAPTYTGEKNHEITKHARLRLEQLGAFVADEAPFSQHQAGFAIKLVSAAGALLSFAALITVFLNAVKKSRGGGRRIIFIYVFFGASFITTIFSAGSWRPFHLGILFPFVQLASALFVINMLDLPDSRRLGRAIAIIFVLVVLISRTALMGDYYAAFTERSLSSYTDDESVGVLIEYVKSNKLFPCVFTNANTDEAVFVLSKGGISSYGGGFNISYHNSRDAATNFLDRHLGKLKEIFIVETLRNSQWDLQWLNDYAVSRGRHAQLTTKINDKDNNRTLYNIYRIY